MEPALDEIDWSVAVPSSQVDYTPSGVVPLGRARRLPSERPGSDPFIEAFELDGPHAAHVALEELAAADAEAEELAAICVVWDDDEETTRCEWPPQSVHAELPPVEVRDALVHAVLLSAREEDWDDEAITTRYDSPCIVFTGFDDGQLEVVDTLAAELRIAAHHRDITAAGMRTGFLAPRRRTAPALSPWARRPGWTDGSGELVLTDEPDAQGWGWRQWLLVGTLTLAAELVLFGLTALALG